MSLIEIFTLPFFNLIIWFLGLIPTISLPDNFYSAVDTGAGYLSTLGYFVSLPTLSGIIVFYLSWYFFKLFFHAVSGFLSFIPFIGSAK